MVTFHMYAMIFGRDIMIFKVSGNPELNFGPGVFKQIQIERRIRLNGWLGKKANERRIERNRRAMLAF